MDHNEHPAIGCVRETLEELGLEVVLDNHEPVITQQVFNDEISFVSLTYRSSWNGDIDELTLQTEEISEAGSFRLRKRWTMLFPTLTGRHCVSVALIKGRVVDALRSVRRQDPLHESRHLERTLGDHATTLDVVDIERRSSTALYRSLATVSSVTPIINLPPPSADPSTASVGLLASSVNSLSIVVMVFKSPSIPSQRREHHRALW